jgi:hypothetical protein
MKTRPVLSLLFLLTMLMSLARLEGAPNPVDHLLPFRASGFDEFRPSLYKKLLLTPGNYGRMIEFVGEPNRGEFAVSVQCGEGAGAGNKCSVTLTKVRQNLGSIMVEHWGKGPLELINRVRAVRKDAPIAPGTALAIRSIWTKMLRHVKPHRFDGSVVVDSERIEFFLGQPNPTWFFGETPDTSGPTVLAFVELGRLLAKYCEVPAHERDALASKIELDAKRLAARVPN